MKRIASESGAEVVFISAKTGAGCSKLVETIEKIVNEGKKHVILFIPPEDGAITGLIYKEADSVNIEYLPDGIRCECVVDNKLYPKIKKYIQEEK